MTLCDGKYIEKGKLFVSPTICFSKNIKYLCSLVARSPKLLIIVYNYYSWHHEKSLCSLLKKSMFLSRKSSPTKRANIKRNQEDEEVLNPLYLQFIKQDSSFVSWLLPTISPEFLPQLVGSKITTVIWKAVTKRYSNLSTTKVMNLRYRIRSMKKVTQSMHEYTMAIKANM
ncbi:hypothetical protein GQ457_02G024910 [Hibiscus cannabinus]